MPKGITQDQVNAAIDALVASGERPHHRTRARRARHRFAEHAHAHA